MKLNSFVKTAIASTLFPLGSIRTVLYGPCRGLKYRIFQGYSLAYLYGGREPAEMRVMGRLLKPGSIAYDLGANYGMHTLLMARLVGATGRVFAFEPQHDVFAALSENIKLNGFENTMRFQLAIADHAGTLRFDMSPSTATGHLSDSAAECVVQATSLDEFVLDLGNPVPDFIKIDVEGAETKVLEGGMRVLRQFRPNLLIELHNPAQDRGVGKVLHDLNYCVMRADTGEPVESLLMGWPDPNGIWGTVVATSR